MHNTLSTPVPPSLSFAQSTRALRGRLVVTLSMLLVLLLSAAANASTPADFQKQMDGKATTFCQYLQVLPDSKWVDLGSLILIMIGVVLLFFGRGASSWLMKGIGAIVIIPGILGIAKAFGIGC